jgi:hypothetical protein
MEKSNFIEIYNMYDQEFCDKTIAFFEHCIDSGFAKQRDEVGYSLQTADDSAVNFPNAEFPFFHAPLDITEPFHDGLYKALGMYHEKYVYFPAPELQSYNIKMQKTEPGQGFHTWHYENGVKTMANRVLTWSMYLNDNFEAGETEFLYQHYRYKPKAGDLIIWPAGFTHTHRGNPPINGTKYILTGWLEL